MNGSYRRDFLKFGGLAAAGLALPTSANTASPDPSEKLSMFAVIFEVHPHPDRQQDYLDTAKALRPMLDEIDGFEFIDRFGSRVRPGWLLSLSFWADEAALTVWRTREKHHLAQSDGRERIFADYRIRVAQVVTDDSPGQPTRRPERRSAYNDLTRRKVSYMGFLETNQEPGGELSRDLMAIVGDAEKMDSLYNPDKVIYTRTWDGEGLAMTWRDSLLQNLHLHNPSIRTRLRIVEVERDYTLVGRDQAPQYHPAVKRPTD